MPRPLLLTEAEFDAWLEAARVPVFIYPYRIVVCACGDLNCHGWRLVRAA